MIVVGVFSGIFLERGLTRLAAEAVVLALIFRSGRRVFHPKFYAGKVVVVAADFACPGLPAGPR
jgi:hypothetical protein